MRRRVFLAAAICFCVAMLPVVCFGENEDDVGVSVSKTVSVPDTRSVKRGDEVSYTITVSVSSGTALRDPYVLESPSEYLENINITGITGMIDEGGTEVDLDVDSSIESLGNGGKKISFWDPEELTSGQDGPHMISEGSRIIISVTAKIREDAPAGDIVNTAALYGESELVDDPEPAALGSDSATVNVVVDPEPAPADEPETTTSAKAESEDNVSGTDESPDCGDHGLAGCLWSWAD